MLFDDVRVAVLGGGDLASGVIYRLYRAGFPVVVTELPAPLFVRRAVSFGEAVYRDEITVEGVTARRAIDIDEVSVFWRRGVVPVVVDPDGDMLARLNVAVVVDARMEKRNLGVRRGDAPLVVALGPGFTAEDDVDFVIETNRGHDLGRVIREGAAEPDTGEPGRVKGITHSRVLRAPLAGHVHANFEIGDFVATDDEIAMISGEPVVAAFDGVLRGIIHPSVEAWAGLKIGDLDPRGNRENCFKISDKSLAVGGGVVEAVLSAAVVRELVAGVG